MRRQSVLDASLSISTCIVTNDYIVRHETNAYFTGHFDKPRIYLYSVLVTYEKKEMKENRFFESNYQFLALHKTQPPAVATGGGGNETRKRYIVFRTRNK